MPDPPPSIKWHPNLEWFRRIGLDSMQNHEDDTIKWRTVIFFLLISLGTLATFVVLTFDVVPGGANVWTVDAWGEQVPSGSCEFENGAKMVHQMSSAISASAYTFVGILIAMLTWFDAVIVWQRFRARMKSLPPRPYCKGPNGNEHIKVTAIYAKRFGEFHEHPTFVSVDPEYLRGSVPSLLRREPLWGLLISLSVNFLGVAGYLFHASTSRLALRLDNTAWFTVGCAFTAYIAARGFSDSASPRTNVCGFCEPCGVVCRVQCDGNARRLGSKASTLLLVSIAVALDVVAGLFFELENYYVIWLSFGIMALVSFVSLNVHYFGRRQEVDVWFELGLYSVLCFAIGLLFLHYDTVGLCVDKFGYFQAHAIWHCFSAVAIGFLYLALRSDMWMYDLIDAKEERRTGALDDAYRVPGLLEFDPNAPQSFSQGDPRRLSEHSSRRVVDADTPQASRPRTLERDHSSRRKTLEREDSQPRPKTLEREDSESSRTSSRRLDNLRAQARNRDSKKTQRTLDSDSDFGSSMGAAYWTCPECAFEDNELAYTVCERCQAERPPLDEFVPMSVVQGYM